MRSKKIVLAAALLSLSGLANAHAWHGHFHYVPSPDVIIVPVPVPVGPPADPYAGNLQLKCERMGELAAFIGAQRDKKISMETELATIRQHEETTNMQIGLAHEVESFVLTAYYEPTMSPADVQALVFARCLMQ